MKRDLSAKKVNEIIESTKINEDSSQDQRLLDLIKVCENSLRAVGDAEFELVKDVSAIKGYVENVLKANTPVDGKGIANRLTPKANILDKSCFKM